MTNYWSKEKDGVDDIYKGKEVSILEIDPEDEFEKIHRADILARKQFEESQKDIEKG